MADPVLVIHEKFKPYDYNWLRTEMRSNGIPRFRSARVEDWKEVAETLSDRSYALVLGAVALQATLPLKVKLSDVRGRWWKLSTGQWTMASYHPGVVSHGYSPNQEATLKRDIEKFAGSVTLQDLNPPKMTEQCLVCYKFATTYINKLGFCGLHTPRKRKVKTWEQMSLDL